MTDQPVGTPDAIASEGFRGVMWLTRNRDIPWKWSNEGVSAPCFIREDEDYDVFGIRARALTYTFRNSVLYGVRIDYDGCERNATVLREALKTYRPSGGIEHRGTLERAWHTRETSVWISLAESHDSSGTVRLWSCHGMSEDDTQAPFMTP